MCFYPCTSGCAIFQDPGHLAAPLRLQPGELILRSRMPAVCSRFHDRLEAYLLLRVTFGYLYSGLFSNLWIAIEVERGASLFVTAYHLNQRGNPSPCLCHCERSAFPVRHACPACHERSGVERSVGICPCRLRSVVCGPLSLSAVCGPPSVVHHCFTACGGSR